MTTSIDAATTLSTTVDALALDILRGATRALGSPQSNVIPQSTIHLPGPGPWDLCDFDDNYNIFVPWGIAATSQPGAVAAGLLALVIKLGVLAVSLAILETSVAKLRLFRVPELLTGSFMLALLAVISFFFVR